MERSGRGRAPDFTLVQPSSPCPAGTLVEVTVEGQDGRVLIGTARGPVQQA